MKFGTRRKNGAAFVDARGKVDNQGANPAKADYPTCPDPEHPPPTRLKSFGIIPTQKAVVRHFSN